jgi:hypothetical protein
MVRINVETCTWILFWLAPEQEVYVKFSCVLVILFLGIESDRQNATFATNN